MISKTDLMKPARSDSNAVCGISSAVPEVYSVLILRPVGPSLIADSDIEKDHVDPGILLKLLENLCLIALLIYNILIGKEDHIRRGSLQCGCSGKTYSFFIHGEGFYQMTVMVEYLFRIA